MAVIPTLSAHGCEMPVIGFGTSQLGNCGEIVATALKLGYRHIDTAWKYGTEDGVGDGIKASGVPRKEIFLCTKVSHEYLRAADFARVDCVLVDEAQFLRRAQVWQLTDVVDVLRVPVLAYGLRTDFRGELFEGSQYLLAWADNLVEIKTICHSGAKATMVVRVDANGRAVTDGPQVEIGGNDRYVSVSRAEFKKIMAGDSQVELQQPVLPLDMPEGEP